MHVLLIGEKGGTHVAGGFSRACAKLGIACDLVEYRELLSAFPLWRVVRKLARHPISHWYQRPSVARVLRRIDERSTTLLLVCGTYRLPDRLLEHCHRRGVKTAIFLTDSPDNEGIPQWIDPAQFAKYDLVLSPRISALDRLRKLGCSRPRYFPFSVDPDLHYPSEPVPAAGSPDILFVGGGDTDRLPVMRALLELPYQVEIYGLYWPKLLRHHPSAHDFTPPEKLRAKTNTAKINVCLVRRINRDGHVMRTLEIAACMGYCLAERTEEHEALLGPEGEAALFFSSVEEMKAKITRLMADPELRIKHARNLHARAAEHTYEKSLARLLGEMGMSAH